MTAESLENVPSGLFARVRNILITPAKEWARIAEEEPRGPLFGYVAPLAIIAALAGVAAKLLYSGFEIDAAFGWTAISALLHIAFAIVSVAAASFMLNWLAPRFGGEANAGRAGQLAAYASTAILLAGITVLIPLIAPLFLLGGMIYSVVLIGLGTPMLLAVPDDRRVPFMLSFVGACIAAVAIFFALAAPLIASTRDQAMTFAAGMVRPESAAIETDAPASIAERSLAKMRQTYARRAPSPVESLEVLLPRTLPGGFALASVSPNTAQGVASVSALYRAGEAEMTVSLVQFAAAESLAEIAARLHVEEGRGAAGYARTQQLDERLFLEEVSPTRARFGIIGRGVALVAEGPPPLSIDQARSALETIDIARVERALLY